jgi:hypothetical protein
MLAPAAKAVIARKAASDFNSCIRTPESRL